MIARLRGKPWVTTRRVRNMTVVSWRVGRKVWYRVLVPDTAWDFRVEADPMKALRQGDDLYVPIMDTIHQVPPQWAHVTSDGSISWYER